MLADTRPTDASLSTMWAIKNYPNLDDFIQVARQLGVQKVELNHQVDSAMLAHLDLDHIRFSSVHEPCPADISSKDLVDRDWLVSSPDRTSRQLGVDAVRKSIELAHQLSAPVVVVHCGTIPSQGTHEHKLRKLFESGNSDSDEYQEIKGQFIQSRNALAAPRLAAVKESLLELLNYAHHRAVKLGLENRYHYMDIPSLSEMDELLRLADPDHLGFIYDVGHAQALDRLGFYPHEDWLKRYSTRMLGAHLHDVLGVGDHLSPGRGEIDFNIIRPYLPANSFRTIELHPGNTLAQVKHGLSLLVDAGCIKYL